MCRFNKKLSAQQPQQVLIITLNSTFTVTSVRCVIQTRKTHPTCRNFPFSFPFFSLEVYKTPALFDRTLITVSACWCPRNNALTKSSVVSKWFLCLLDNVWGTKSSNNVIHIIDFFMVRNIFQARKKSSLKQKTFDANSRLPSVVTWSSSVLFVSVMIQYFPFQQSVARYREACLEKSWWICFGFISQQFCSVSCVYTSYLQPSIVYM